ncbi:hypothetical protein, partial [Nitrosomonas sp.]|uniref:hypothetical protein n=1 Tax=Nitrosomonas sp. TaxID=42353 RepID=UPI0025E4177C
FGTLGMFACAAPISRPPNIAATIFGHSLPFISLSFGFPFSFLLSFSIFLFSFYYLLYCKRSKPYTPQLAIPQQSSSKTTEYSYICQGNLADKLT